ncbi:hypothetical protein MesoLjLc_78490 [Mesorhizobium sp. L-8-10]|uniref:hypothetical protein n=1 Tax=unclassified Mesorhizobium TaxID=325217 RepID=UPI0019284244|nr:MULTISPECIES: hypothetical protein [unclassified Mesorhizobium]BCH28046.1 hypothetical protein MesoLjLb_78310 [Mesorhizobium sp. L-8-3]BCH35919.1 hypothetical protein MesoLjLc_78490 [Mesorhizobium sp. L-8-10]
MIEAGIPKDMTADTPTAADATDLERGPCGGICALCPKRHAAVRSALAAGEGERNGRKH